MSAYSSTDGGKHWSEADATALRDAPGGCVDGDPAVAIAPSGRQYAGFLAETPCGSKPRVYVATRAGPRAAWEPATRAVAPLQRETSDDKPALAVDSSDSSPHRGRIYVAWARNREATVKSQGLDSGAILIVHSDDGGRTWSPPARVSPATQLAFSASVAVAPNSRVFVAWDDPGNQGLWIDRAADGVHFGEDRLVAPYPPLVVERCDVYGNSIPAQPYRCVRPNPVLSLDSRAHRPMRAYVTYGNIEANDSQGIFLVAFDSNLRAVIGNPNGDGGVRIGPADGRVPSDQFWPASAFDPTSGLLWICYYDTRGDKTRRSASFTCLATRDGRRWLGPKRVASVSSDGRTTRRTGSSSETTKALASPAVARIRSGQTRETCALARRRYIRRRSAQQTR